ncbi:MAG: HAMP domain-containing protein, partial [Ktedonobacteraceae bacterium]|nr:HAMP domain-containing protein [Ktedonobacteraceae bacterium]
MKQNVAQRSSTWLPGMPITLQLRMALWTSGLFVVLCLILVTFINVATILLKPQQLLSISIIGFLFVTIGGGFGAYWIAGISLRPVKKMSDAAAHISASTLSTRLSLPGPQDELHALAATFDAMLDRLEQAFEQQSRFVADAAHELRTPLATLRTNLEVTGRNAHATLSDYQHLFVIVERAVIRLELLVAALLVLATEKQAIKLQAVSLLPLLEEIISDLQSTASDHQVTLHLEAYTTTSLYGDEHLLALVFRNLIENGIRYNRPDGTVTITIADSSIGVH